MSRVLSTQEAKNSIRQIQTIVNGSLQETLSNLDNQGTILSSPENWDGPLAQQFRGSTWPETQQALRKAKQELDDLRTQLDKIANDIFAAGGA